MSRGLIIHSLLALSLTAFMPYWSQAADDEWPPPPVQPKPTDPRTLRRVTVSLEKVPLRKALTSLFKDSKLKFVVEPAVTDVPMTLKIRDITFDTAVRLFVRQAGVAVPDLEYRYRNGVYRLFVKGDDEVNEPEL